jgi:hypothetical protein
MAASHSYEEFRDTPLWRTMEAAVAELSATHEITVATAPEYVIGYLCQQIVARKLAAPAALTYDP